MKLQKIEWDRSSLLRSLSWFIVIALGIYCGLILIGDVGKIKELLNNFPLALLPFLIVLSLASYVCRFARWQLFLYRLGHPIPVIDSMFLYFSGFALTTTPGKSGEMIRSLFLKQWGVPYSQSIAAFISERLLDVFVILILSLMAVLSLLHNSLWIITVFIGLVVALLLLPTNWIYKFLVRYTPIQVRDHILNIHIFISKLVSRRKAIIPIMLGMVSWILQGSSFYLLLDGLGSAQDYFIAVGIYSLSILIGAISFIAGGIGVTESAMVLLLLMIGVDSATAVIAALGSRILTLWLAIFLGILSMLRLGVVINQVPGKNATVVDSMDSGDNSNSGQMKSRK